VVFSPLFAFPTNQTHHTQVIDDFPINPQEILFIARRIGQSNEAGLVESKTTNMRGI
jgi:hypothetical protein